MQQPTSWPGVPVVSIAAFCLASVCSPAAGLEPLAPRVASYSIGVTLDPGAHTISARETLNWRNVTQHPATELQFHLYLNAFKNERSTFMKETHGVSRSNRFREGEWGYIDIASMKLPDGSDLLRSAEFIRPDDGNVDDETVLRVPLPNPVPPGGAVAVDIEFAARLPRVFARTGYKNDFYFVAQWFPKVGVFTGPAWNCHQFHGHSEFFSDFGDYDVAITVPRGYVVGATGARQGEPVAGKDGSETVRYTQNDVHDFAWTADPDYVKVVRWFRYADQRDAIEEERVARILDLPSGSDQLHLPDVEVTVLLHPEHAAQVERHFTAVFHALRYFGYWYGPYPYRTLTVVDPAWGARGAGGMEYPTLITAGTSYLAPSLRQSPESVTIHEFGHQYWYGMVATNEFEEAFLDEGFNTYSTGLVLEKAYGPNRDQLEIAPGIPMLAVPLFEIPRGADTGADNPAPRDNAATLTDLMLLRPFGPSDDVTLNSFRDIPFLNYITDAPIDEVTNQRRRYLRAPKADEMARRSWEYLDTESYGLNSYARPALVLRTLEGILGRDVMFKVMRAWFTKHRFGHPTVEDFISTVNEVSGRSMDQFLEQAIHGSVLLDYTAASVSSKVPDVAAGVFGPPDARKTVKRKKAEGPTAGAVFENRVLVRRLGEFVRPQEVELRYETGPAVRRIWDGEYRWVRFEESGAKLISARVDPEGRMALDANQSNNSHTVTPDPRAGLKWWSRLLQWMQHVVYFYSGIS